MARYCTSSVDFQPQPGQQTCLTCPYNAQASKQHSDCECEAGYYAVPFGDYSLFEQLDSESYHIYRNAFIDADEPPEYDPNESLGYWCVRCPEGDSLNNSNDPK